MIIVVVPSDEPEDRAADVCRAFASVIHSRTPDNHVIDLHAAHLPHRRAFCGDLECGGTGRVIPTSQGLCPKCGGRVTSASEVASIRARFRIAKRMGFDAAAEAEAKRRATLARKASRHFVAA